MQAGAAEAPRNDLFANRTLLTGNATVVSTYLTNATVEPGEPSHAGANVTRSLWWSWTAPYTGWANFSTYGSDGRKILAVYTGETLETLSAVGATKGDDWYSGGKLVRGDSINIPVREGITYQIAVATSSAASLHEGPDRVVLGINQRPAILSPALVRATVGQAFRLNADVANPPTEFSATGLPPGVIVSSNVSFSIGREGRFPAIPGPRWMPPWKSKPPTPKAKLRPS